LKNKKSDTSESSSNDDSSSVSEVEEISQRRTRQSQRTQTIISGENRITLSTKDNRKLKTQPVEFPKTQNFSSDDSSVASKGYKKQKTHEFPKTQGFSSDEELHDKHALVIPSFKEDIATRSPSDNDEIASARSPSPSSRQTPASQGRKLFAPSHHSTPAHEVNKWKEHEYDILMTFAAKNAADFGDSYQSLKMWEKAEYLNICPGRSAQAMREALRRMVRDRKRKEAEYAFDDEDYSTQRDEGAQRDEDAQRDEGAQREDSPSPVISYSNKVVLSAADDLSVRDPEHLNFLLSKLAKDVDLEFSVIYWLAFQLNGDFSSVHDVCYKKSKYLNLKYTII